VIVTCVKVTADALEAQLLLVFVIIEMLIVGFEGDEILVSAQSVDAFARPLSSYEYDISRFIRIDGVRFDSRPSEDCFQSVYNGEAIIRAK
ncbi:MAG: hypothetical protein IIX30_00785, partial [Clostridia bacterium]|nr:hypothetical protein [Clostridia bacterium]